MPITIRWKVSDYVKMLVYDLKQNLKTMNWK